MFVNQASYLRPISSSAMVTFWPFGVAIEYSWRGWVPTSSSFTVRAPAVGLLSCMYSIANIASSTRSQRFALLAEKRGRHTAVLSGVVTASPRQIDLTPTYTVSSSFLHLSHMTLAVPIHGFSLSFSGWKSEWEIYSCAVYTAPQPTDSRGRLWTTMSTTYVRLSSRPESTKSLETNSIVSASRVQISTRNRLVTQLHPSLSPSPFRPTHSARVYCKRPRK